MSGTINGENFAKRIGMNDDEYKFTDTKKSPFSKESREIDFIDACRLNYRSSEKNKNAITKQIENSKTYQNEKYLILTSSKKHCFEILYGLQQEQRFRIQIAHSSENKKKSGQQ